MANTYTLIQAQTLTNSSTSAVTFSSIPATYTDLVFRLSTRDNGSGTVDGQILWRLNGGTSGYSSTGLRGNGAAAASSRSSAVTYNGWVYSYTDGSTATASTFGNAEIYIPNYTSTTSKPQSFFGVGETNATTAYMGVTAELSSLTSAITSVEISLGAGPFLTGSSFYLYGIKSS